MNRMAGIERVFRHQIICLSKNFAYVFRITTKNNHQTSFATLFIKNTIQINKPHITRCPSSASV